MAYNRHKHQRTKLKRHDQGQDRHNKVLAYWHKLNRQQSQRNKIQGKGKRDHGE